MSAVRLPGCPLCESAGGTLIAQGAKWRLIRADEPGFPAFYRLVWNDHVRELTDLNGRELLVLGALAIAVLWMGLYPKPFTDVMHTSVTELLRHVAVPKI